MGGGFGGKATGNARIAAGCALASHVLNRYCMQL